ncbi:radical SAM protein [uncultured Mesotoga sp.]|uniref:radical SAM protein n=2 Tax=Mesotoga TaxID=1184396 RepID=UPI0025991D7C|nr:radical SAM protein [uncultured Mesotoga sp.]MCP5456856.1 radical SAM protein [Thermotogota bacterium]
MNALIIDGYTDEPAAFGVPPYISPRIRAIAGAFLLKGIETDYLTIDSVRQEGLWEKGNDYDFLIVFGGVTTSGRYIGGTPISSSEISLLLKSNSDPTKIVSGPVVSVGYTLRGGTTAFTPDFREADYLLRDEFEIADFLGLDSGGSRYSLLNRLYPAGADVIRLHPCFPDLMVEIDISSGCERLDGFCSFCTESILYGSFEWRSIKGIVAEFEKLKEVGVKAIRFGRSANVIAYGYDRRRDTLDPSLSEELFKSARSIIQPEVFHIDNGNPIFIAHHPSESRSVIESIVRYNTAGDTISFGVESFDDEVRSLNNLGGSVQDIIFSIELVNEIGKERVEGVPKLLPGINLLYGLPGQSRKSFDIDYDELVSIQERGLLLRRINIRQTMIFPGARIFNMTRPRIDHRLFEKHKHRIRKEIDSKMLKKTFPLGAIIRGVIPEFSEGMIYFGRPLGTYPILVGSPVGFEEITDFVVIDHGMRSITGLPVGTELNDLGEREMRFIPGIGRDRAKSLVIKRPRTREELIKIVGPETHKTLSLIKTKLGGKWL